MPLESKANFLTWTPSLLSKYTAFGVGNDLSFQLAIMIRSWKKNTVKGKYQSSFSPTTDHPIELTYNTCQIVFVEE
jgi:hypothetical protein